MKYLKLCFLFFLISYFNCYANTYNQDSVLFSNKSTEGIAKMIYAYMEDYETTMLTYGNIKISDGEKKGRQQYKDKFIDRLVSYNKSSSLLDSIDVFLSKKENNWSSTGLKLFTKLKENYSTQLKSKNYNLNAVFDVGDLTLIYIKKQDKRLNDLAQWKKTLAEILETKEEPVDFSSQNISENVKIPIAEIPIKATNENDKINENKGSLFFRIMSYILIFILGCLSAIVFFNFRIKNILEEEYKEYKSQIKASHKKYPPFIFGIIQFLKEKKNSYKNKTSSSVTGSNDKHTFERLTEENKKLIIRNRELEAMDFKSNDQSNNNILTGENIIDENTGIQKSPEKKATILYFSIAEKDGSFFEDKSTNTALVRSYYQIEYVDGQRTGKLTYRSGNLDVSALSQMDYILGPVCEIENSSMNNPSRIIVQSSGSVIKEDDKWKIKDKIKIKLI